MNRKRVGILGDSSAQRYRWLFDALGQLFAIDFPRLTSPDDTRLDALVVLNGDVAAGIAAAADGHPAYVVVESDPPVDGAADSEVHFTGSAILEAPLRNGVMRAQESGRLYPVTVQPGDEVLASQGGHPIWLNRRIGLGGCQVVGCGPPILGPGEFLFEYLSGPRFLRLLPLLNFLRQLVAEEDWLSPASRACFVFDDPNLHWRSYGYIRYRRLAAHAREHAYCVAIATVPLDACWVSSEVAEIIRFSSPRLGLLVHGNNHTWRELLQQQDGMSHLAVVAQAMRRMERLEQRSRIRFHRVMEPPHGTMACDIFKSLLVLGYEAALCTTESLVRDNPRVAWPAAFGLGLSETLGEGLPVLPRIRMSPHWKNDLYLAAFLRQPIILAGHHQDAAGEMRFLAELASTVNTLEGVSWSDIPGILLTNYRQRREGDLLRVKMCSRRVRVPIPDGVRYLQVERPWIAETTTERITLVSQDSTHTFAQAGPVSEPFGCGDAATVEVTSEVPNPLHFSGITMPSRRLWPLARKITMEARDRLSPLLPFVDKLRRRTNIQAQ